MNATNLFLDILICGNYIGNSDKLYILAFYPPINIAVNWEDMNIHVVVSESSRLPGLYDNRGPSQSTEEGSR